MNQIKPKIIVISSILFLSIIIFTSNLVMETKLSVRIFVTGCFLGLLVLFYIINYYSIKKKIDKEKEASVNKESTINRSYIISLIMVLYSFIFIGSSVTTANELLLLISGIIRISAIFVGLYLFFINFYLIYINLKLSSLVYLLSATALVFLSAFYFIFVSYWTIIDLM